MASAGIVRVTMFKVPDEENQQKLLGLYKTVTQTAVKNDRPYIVSFQAGQTFEDPRSQGYTVVAKSEFRNKEDMAYYDSECQAHKNFKAAARELGVEGVLITYFAPSVVMSL
ncbi:MAG: hypothetical protein M1840_002592 [Geoglossum simile]|nr:MAG: hypothetical protein M1840_002592 [Geoglossum simile]